MLGDQDRRGQTGGSGCPLYHRTVLAGMCIIHSLLCTYSGFNRYRISLSKEYIIQCCNASQPRQVHTLILQQADSALVLASDLRTGPDQCITAGQIRSTLSVSALHSHSFSAPAIGGMVSNPPFPASPHSLETQ